VRRLRGLFLVLLVAVPLALVLWRGRGDEPGVVPRHPIEPVEERSLNAVGAAPQRIGPGPVPDLPRSLLVDEALDLTGDGVRERVQLYVDAESGPDGRLHWDDGQRWVLLVRADGGVYTLLDRYVQIGGLRFWVMEEAGEEAPRLVLLHAAGAGISLTSFRYQQPQAFVATPEFAVTGNLVFTSPDPE
jgi:hypothetical protein